jgi:hypothetical protein
MASYEPRDLEKMRRLELGHLLTQHGNRALPHVFDRLDAPLVSSPANRIFAEREPGRSVRDRLRDLTKATQKQRKVVLSSHAIPDDAFDALVANDGGGFVECRTRHLKAREEEFMRSLSITPSDQLGSSGPEMDADDDENGDAV